MNPHTIATEHNIYYDGDVNPIDHGGVWYSLQDWSEYGYATALRIWQEDDAPYGIYVERLTINKPDDMSGALSYCGIDTAPTMQEEIYACLSYGHYDMHDDCWTPSTQVYIRQEEREEESMVSAREAQAVLFCHSYSPIYFEDETTVETAILETIKDLF